METHGSDATSSSEDAAPWRELGAELRGLGESLGAVYRRVAGEDGPSEEELKTAVSTLAAAWGQVAGSVSAALDDPRVREHLRRTASGLAAALGSTIADLGTDLRPNPSDEAEEPATEDDRLAG